MIGGTAPARWQAHARTWHHARAPAGLSIATSNVSRSGVVFILSTSATIPRLLPPHRTGRSREQTRHQRIDRLAPNVIPLRKLASCVGRKLCVLACRAKRSPCDGGLTPALGGRRRELGALANSQTCSPRSVPACSNTRREHPSAHLHRPATFSRILPPRRRCCTASWICSRGYTPATGTTRVPSVTSGAASRMTGTTLSR